MLLALLPSLLWCTASFTSYTYLGATLAERHGPDAVVALFLVYGLGGLAGSQAGGRLADRFGPTLPMVACLAVAVVNQSLLGLADVGVVTLGVALAVWSFTGWATFAPQQSRLLGIEPENGPLVIALNNSTIYLGSAFGAALGGVDGFDQDHAASECHDGIIALVGFLAPQGDAFETLQLAHGLLDTGARFVERFGKERGSILGIGPAWDDREDAALATGRAIGLRITTFVGQCGPWRDVGADVEGGVELCAVAHLAAGEVEGDWQAVKVCFERDFAREPAARTAEGLILLPPFAPAAETCARTTVLSNTCTKCAVLLVSARSWKNASNTPDRLSHLRCHSPRCRGRNLGQLRQNRFQTLFQLPYSLGSARQVRLWTVKKCIASRNLRSSWPGSPRRDCAASNTSSVMLQSFCVIPVSMARLHDTGRPLVRKNPIRESP